MPTEVVGAVELRKALNQYAPDLAKELTKELGNILKPIVNEARSYVPIASPMSGWAKREHLAVVGFLSMMLWKSVRALSTRQHHLSQMQQALLILCVFRISL